jgi:hypothetical protein
VGDSISLFVKMLLSYSLPLLVSLSRCCSFAPYEQKRRARISEEALQEKQGL